VCCIMVLEAFAAVSLTGNIFQFIDFSCKLFSTTASLHHSYAGATRDIQQLNSITQALQQWCVELATLQKAHGSQIAGLRNQSLVRLGTDCKDAALDLLSATNALEAKAPSSKWSSFKVALAVIWNDAQIKDMERRLDSYRLQLILELKMMQRYGILTNVLCSTLTTWHQQRPSEHNVSTRYPFEIEPTSGRGYDHADFKLENRRKRYPGATQKRYGSCKGYAFSR
jgi:hypothetical protein